MYFLDYRNHPTFNQLLTLTSKSLVKKNGIITPKRAATNLSAISTVTFMKIKFYNLEDSSL